MDKFIVTNLYPSWELASGGTLLTSSNFKFPSQVCLNLMPHQGNFTKMPTIDDQDSSKTSTNDPKTENTINTLFSQSQRIMSADEVVFMYKLIPQHVT